MTHNKLKQLIDLDPMFGIKELLPILKGRQKTNDSMFSTLGKLDKEKIKIAILSSFSIQHLNEILSLYLAENGIDCEIYEAVFDSVDFELMNESSKLYNFKPQYLIFLSDYRDIKQYPDIGGNNNSLDECLKLHTKKIELLWDKAKSLGVIKIFQTNYVKPIERQLGNFDNILQTSRSSFISVINSWLVEHCIGGIGLLDFEYLASYVGKKTWFSEKDYFLSKQGISFDVMGLASHLIARAISENVKGPNKCLVVDLDNTLWGGVIGDDGLNGIILGPDNAVGEAYVFFQKYLKLLKDRGVLLAVCTKNDKRLAERVFKEHPHMILRFEDIASFVANWDDKASNIKKIADELNISIDSLVFFDDNPAERHLIKKSLPTVKVVNVPNDVAIYVRALELGMFFDWPTVTREDLTRADSYSRQSDREKLINSSISYEDYLISLGMDITIKIVEYEDLARVCQLINKTNQFNVRSSRIGEDKLDKYMKSINHKVISIKLKDIYSSYGVIACVVLERKRNICFVSIWVMSCRVFNRNIEYEVIGNIVAHANEWKCDRVIGEYIPTNKNGYVENIFKENGFTDISENDGTQRFEMLIADYKKRSSVFNRKK
jgi:FkbH-like protein